MRLIRAVLGFLVLLWDRLTSPQPLIRSPEDQKSIDEQTRSIALYQFEACPFCVKVRREIRRLGLNVETRDARAEGRHRDDLKNQGGVIQVPCLRISEPGKERWLYESDAIIAYLRSRFASPSGLSGAS